ncbi:MAG TPA: ATP-binding cassette domain-containing protein [Candidatus Dormibacteraeota bacterium]|nr:ATP-binding cassette domain-containing protein [Candidatus Dormibacteraeota bacterium]
MSALSGSDGRPIIAARQLTKSFETGRRGRRQLVEAVRQISFEVSPAERIAYIGPNGAGKSTSIKMLTGILHPSAGAATVMGMVPWRQRRELTRRIGTLFGQRSQLWFELTPRETFRMLGAIYGLERSDLRSRVGQLGDLLEAEDLFDQPVRSLSLGQRMRCELAACLLHQPAVMFLDEPTIGLDLLAKQRFRELLVRLNQEQGTTIFLTSHDVADIEHVAQRAIVINHGVVIYDDDVSAMRRSLLATKLVELTLAGPTDFAGMAGVAVAEHTATTLRLVVDTAVRPVREVLDALLLDLDVTDVTVTDPPLEEVIAEIYARPRT